MDISGSSNPCHEPYINPQYPVRDTGFYAMRGGPSRLRCHQAARRIIRRDGEFFSEVSGRISPGVVHTNHCHKPQNQSSCAPLPFERRVVHTLPHYKPCNGISCAPLLAKSEVNKFASANRPGHVTLRYAGSTVTSEALLRAPGGDRDGAGRR